MEVSQKRGLIELGSGTASTTRIEVGEEWSERICGSVARVLAIAVKSIDLTEEHWF